jgi:hypothetical protein
MFNHSGLFQLGLIAMAAMAVAVIAFFVLTSSNSSVAPPQSTPTPLPSPTEIQVTPTPTEPLQPTPTPVEEKPMVFTEEELQSKLNQIVELANESGSAQISYIRVKLHQDRMLISGQGEAYGIEAKAEDIEARFEDKTVFASGEGEFSGRKMKVYGDAEIECEQGKPMVEVKKVKVGIFSAPQAVRDQLTGAINNAIHAADLELPMEFESIRIEEGKLTLVGK